MLRILISFALSSLLIFELQPVIDALPDPIESFLSQLPFIGVLLWVWATSDKKQQAEAQKNRDHLDHMLILQREQFNELFTVYRDFSQASLTKADTRLNELSGRIDNLSNQLAVNTGVINEVAKIDDVVDRLFDKLSK